MRGLREPLLEYGLDDEWRGVTELCDQIDVERGGLTWYKVALVLERLVHEGRAELKVPGSRGNRYFRRRQS